MRLIKFIFLLTFFIHPICAANVSSVQERLQHLIHNRREVSPDSIIIWSEQLEAPLLQNKQYKEFFEAKYIVANSHARRGDLSLAIDKVQEMSEEAKRLNYEIGFALSSLAIGDTYIYSNMTSEGISAYKQALNALRMHPRTESLQKIALILLMQTLSSEDTQEEMNFYLHQFNILLPEEDKKSTFYVYRILFNALYAIRQDELNGVEAKLKEAKKYLSADKGYFVTPYWHFVAAKYYEKAEMHALALDEYQKMADILSLGYNPVGYYKTIMNNANLLMKIGRADEACQLYERVGAIKDSLSIRSYSRQVNRLQADYQYNTIALKNQAQKNKLTHLAIIVGACIVCFSIFLTYYIKKGNKRLAESKAHLHIAKKQVEDSIHSKSMFLSNMSHEIRTPLNALSGFSSILTEDAIDNETRLQCADIIQQNSDLLLKLINDVIDLSSLEFGKMQFSFSECDAIMLCRNMVEMVEKIKQTQATIEFRTSLSELTLYTDDARLQQVLINLLINATKFTSSGTITLELSLDEEKAGYARFAVTDTGCGIPLVKQKSIFNRFEKIDERDQGTGLGLSICQLIIERIGGEIWIDPDYTEGSRFCFTHPIKKQD